MNPGRELDALVAEKVMGFQWLMTEPGTVDGPSGYHIRWLSPPGTESTKSWVPWDGRECKRSNSRNVPHYSTDIEVAMKLVDAKMPQFTCERLISGCRVRFFHQNLWPIEAQVYDDGHALTFDKRLAWAICLAALKAVEVPVPT